MDIRRNRAFIFIVTGIAALSALPCGAQQNSASIPWTSADLTASLPSVSLFRYSSVGLGSYPYLSSAPGVPMTVTFDGVPFRAVSPFGPDLDLLPTQFADSVSYENVRELAVFSSGISREEPVTTTSFLLGKRRRFRTNMSFNRSISPQAGILVAGASSGIHGGDFLEKSSARNYFMKYQRALSRPGTLVGWVHAMRDRDGLTDLESDAHMGERRTDGVTMAAGLDDFRLGEGTLLSSKLFYQTMNTRIGRYGSRRSLDDDIAGFRLTVRGGEDSGYHLALSHDVRMFDSRIHDESWIRRKTGVEGGVRLSSGMNSLSLTARETWSGEYGAGAMLDALFERRIGNAGWLVRLRHEDVIPDTGNEYYTLLVFTDSTLVTRQEKYRLDSVETAIRFGSTAEIGIFISRYDHPAYSLITAAVLNRRLDGASYLAGKRDVSGLRLSIGRRVERGLIFEINGDAVYRHIAGDSGRSLWPFPTTKASLMTRISGDFIGGRLHASCFQESQFMNYDAPDGITPDGGYFMLDAGVSLRVRAVELFYTIENLTNEDIGWFDAFGSLKRNGMWGGRWVFLD